MPAAGLGAAELLFHGKSPAPAFVAHLPAVEGILEFDRAHLGRDAGAGKWHHDAGPLDHLAKLRDTGLKIGRDHLYCPMRRPDWPVSCDEVSGGCSFAWAWGSRQSL